MAKKKNPSAKSQYNKQFKGPYRRRTPEEKELYKAVDDAITEREDIIRYPQELKLQAVALSLLYGNPTRAARELDIPVNTVRKWKKAFETDPEIMRAVEERKGNLTTRMQIVMDRALEQIWTKIGESSAAQAATIFGILYDKKTIAEHGGSIAGEGVETTIIYNDMRSMSDDDKSEMLARVLERRKAKKEREEAEKEADAVIETEAEVIEEKPEKKENE